MERLACPLLHLCSLQVYRRYRERKASNGKKRKIFMFLKAAERNLKMGASERMAIKKHKQYGNFAGEKKAW